jgi:hypothetical protein
MDEYLCLYFMNSCKFLDFLEIRYMRKMNGAGAEANIFDKLEPVAAAQNRRAPQDYS